MPVFTAIATAVTAFAATVGFGAAAASFIGGVAAFAARTLLTLGISKLIANRSNSKAAGSQDAGARIQLPPATDNKIPVVYGKAFIAGTVIDAKLSSDNTTMWYVLALAEHTDTTGGSGYTFDDIYYDNKLVTFDGTDPAKVISLTTNTTGTPQVDTKISGNLFIYKFTNGSSSGVNTGGQSAIDIMSDAAIPSDQRWNQGIYTSGGQSATMTNLAFVIVKVIYNTDAGTTNLGSLTVELTNSLDEPGSVILDYLQNTRYGCAVPLSRIDTASLTALNAYSNATITYTPVGGGSATQARYRINGPMNTGLDCLTNLQQLVDSCDSWLQYSELTAQWKVVINQSYTDYTTLSALYSVDSDNLIGGIEVNPIDLNSTYNEMEVQYPNENIKDQTDFQIVSLFTSYPSVISPNEAVNRLTIQLPLVNNAVQAKYLGLRRLLQGREDLVISFATDYSGIQVEAGDVIKVTLSQYGWTDKLFRVNYVGEEKYGDGSLGARLTAFEYNDTIYADNSIQDFIPEDSTGLTDPNVIGTPVCPQVTMDLANTIAVMTVEGTIPTVGQVMYMDFKYGNTSNVQQHLVYKSVSGNGQPLTANSNVSISVTDIPAGNYWWSVVAKNDQVGVSSNSCPNISNVSNWPGPEVTTWDSGNNTGGITNNNIANNTITGSKIANYTITSNKLSNTGVSAGVYTSATVTVGIDGRVTNISNGTSGLSSLIVQEEASNVSTTAIGLNFIGPGVTATAGTGNIANITIQGNGFTRGSAAFNVVDQFANTITLPIDVTANTTRNVPCYIPGTNPGTNYYFPPFQGTSNTASFWQANSTAALEPAFAWTQELQDGDDNWYHVAKASFANTVPNGTSMTYTLTAQLVSDTDNTIVQICPGAQIANTSNVVLPGWVIDTKVLNADLPQQYFYRVGISRATDTDAGTLSIRNMTAGSNVYVIWGGLVVVTANP